MPKITIRVESPIGLPTLKVMLVVWRTLSELGADVQLGEFDDPRYRGLTEGELKFVAGDMPENPDFSGVPIEMVKKQLPLSKGDSNA